MNLYKCKINIIENTVVTEIEKDYSIDIEVINVSFLQPSKRKIELLNEYIHKCNAENVRINRDKIKDLCISEIYYIEFKNLDEYYLERYEELYEAYGTEPIRREMSDYAEHFKFKENDIVKFKKAPNKLFKILPIPASKRNGLFWPLTYTICDINSTLNYDEYAEFENVHQSDLQFVSGFKGEK